MDHQAVRFFSVSRFLVNRNFALLWSGQAISNLGTYVFDTTIVLWIATKVAAGQSWAAAAVSGALIAASLPTLFIGPLAGVFVDRWDQRQTMVRMDIIRTILILSLLLVAGGVFIPFVGNGPAFIWLQLGLIYLVLFLTSICAQFFNPAKFVLTNDIVEEPQRARAIGLVQAMSSIAMLIGPPVGTALFFVLGIQWALLFNAFSFVVSFSCVLLIHTSIPQKTEKQEVRPTIWQDFGEGVRFYLSNAVLMTLLITGILIIAFEGSLEALGVFFVVQNLHAPESYYGFLGAALGAGLTIGAFLAGLLAKYLGVAHMFWTSIVGTGLLILLFARLNTYWPEIGVLFFIGVCFALTNVAYMPLVLHVTPRELLGRVEAVTTPVMTLASLLSVAVAGWLVSGPLHALHLVIAGMTFGSIDTLFLVTGILCIIGGFYSMKKLRGIQIARET